MKLPFSQAVCIAFSRHHSPRHIICLAIRLPLPSHPSPRASALFLSHAGRPSPSPPQKPAHKRLRVQYTVAPAPASTPVRINHLKVNALAQRPLSTLDHLQTPYRVREQYAVARNHSTRTVNSTGVLQRVRQHSRQFDGELFFLLYTKTIEPC